MEWELLWCTERVFKEENVSCCRGLRRSLREHGGWLRCVKKAAHLHVNRNQPKLACWTLVTDWREAQPLSEILWPSNPAALLPCQPPVCTIILCESEMQFSRASVFATKFKNRAGIVPVLCGKIPEVLLFGIIRKHFNSPLTKLHNVKVDERQQQQKQMDENKAPVQLLLFERLKDDAGEFEDKESMTGHGPSLEDIISKHGVPLAASGKTPPH
mmetsp:Transcript_18403/g.36094  ORF Transcript_18403/g.36094 Transcript_18403/m.36094 type:complete len:214 (+) Transcript_18403:76-717(+)